MNGAEFDLPSVEIVRFMLVLGRFGGLVLAAPVFSQAGVPTRVRAIVTIALAAGAASLVPLGAAAELTSVVSLVGALGLELVTGIMFGLAAQLLFAGVLMGGQLADIHMGLGLARVIDPQSKIDATPTALWLQFIALQVFLALDGHHLLVRGVLKSFEIVPPGRLQLTAANMGAFVGLVGGVFEIAVHIAAPVLGGLLIVDTAMGLLSRAIPQLNVFVMGFAIKIVAGFLLLTAAVPFVVQYISQRFGDIDRTLLELLGALA
jgi:flagellar biosynthetic protein FliR